jgi:hypothetical protein
MKLERKVYEVVDPGQYSARLVKVDEREGDWGAYVILCFELLDEDVQGIAVSGAASATFSARSKLYAWAKALLGGRPIPKEYALDTEDLVGRDCLLDLDVKVSKDGAEFNKVVGIRPAQKPEGRRTRQAVPAEAEPEFDFS